MLEIQGHSLTNEKTDPREVERDNEDKCMYPQGVHFSENTGRHKTEWTQKSEHGKNVQS